MSRVFYLKSLELDGESGEILSVLLQEKDTLKEEKWPMSTELMDFSIHNDLLIPTDKRAKVLIYTKKHDNGVISPTIKAFYPGDQRNLLLDEQYLIFHKLNG